MDATQLVARIYDAASEDILGNVYSLSGEWFWRASDGSFGPAIGPFATIQSAVADIVAHLEATRP